MNCESIFSNFFITYCEEKDKKGLSFKVTNRTGAGSHSIPGNAIDITLKQNGNFAWITEYNDLFKHMVKHWPYRAGIDNTYIETAPGKHPNVHIHVDLGGTAMPEALPQFFREEDGKFIRLITKESEV